MGHRANSQSGGAFSKLSPSQKAAATAGSVSALYLLPVVAQGAIIHISTPVSLTLGGTGPVTWSVDGNGGTFQLQGTGTGNASSGVATVSLATGAGSHGQGFVAPFAGNTNSLQALQASFNVGPTLSKYGWGAQLPRAVLRGFETFGSTVTTTYGGTYRLAAHTIRIGAVAGGVLGANFIGFRFTGADNLTHFGWADLNLDTTNGIVTINDWAYNDVAGAPIHIPDTTGPGPSAPEPSTLALLALGAGGLAAFRRRKERSAATLG